VQGDRGPAPVGNIAEEVLEESLPGWDGTKKRAREVIDSLWVLLKKRGADISVDRYKARCVANDTKQRREMRVPGLATFCPSVRHSSFKAQIASACVKEYKAGKRRRFFGCDITQAYLKGECTEQEQTYLRPPPHFRTFDARQRPLVWRLRTPLYGQGDAGRIWYRTLHAQLVRQGFARSQHDPCLYVKGYSNGTTIDIALYVDDMFITTDAGALADKELSILNKKFAMTCKENPVYFLGMNIEYVRLGVIRLTCATYTKTLAANNPNVVGKSSLPSDASLTKAYEASLDKKSPPTEVLLKAYGSKVGALIYMVPCARPDMAAAVGYLAHALTFPTKEMDAEVDRCLRYAIGTPDVGITFDGARGGTLVAYSDSDWSVVHSTSGYCIMLAGAPISYTSKRQQCIALSSTEAEIMAASLAATEIAYLREIFRDLGLYQPDATELYVDNSGAVKPARERKVMHRSRHITRRQLCMREYVAEGIVNVRRVATANNPSDIFTKPLGRASLEKHQSFLMP